MDNTKAIALLRRMQEPEAYEPQITAEAFEALGMAIKALEQASFPQAHENDHIAEVSKMDCISRQAVRLIESSPDAYPQEWNNDYEAGFTDALNKVLALPSAQPEQRWIPCSERLPDKCGNYLVQALGDCIFVDQWRTDQGGYWTAKTPIVAWMPLPEPWKEGETE